VTLGKFPPAYVETRDPPSCSHGSLVEPPPFSGLKSLGRKHKYFFIENVRLLRAGRFSMEFAQSAPMALQRITDASDPARLNRAGIPAEYRTARTKSELALMDIDRAIAADVRFGCVLGMPVMG
jgi:hypothetical protein